MTPITIFLTGFLIRIAFPLLLMSGLVFLLRRLDAHWQKEAMDQQILEAGGTRVHTWELKNCNIAGMAKQPALQSNQPCWQTYRKTNGRLHEECLRCKVFSSTPILLPN